MHEDSGRPDENQKQRQQMGRYPDDCHVSGHDFCIFRHGVCRHPLGAERLDSYFCPAVFGIPDGNLRTAD